MTSLKSIRLRFAPSPNGYLHLGHAYSSLVNAHFAKLFDGQLLLRMENIDTSRCTLFYEQAILADLEWLGIKFEHPYRRQSEHFNDYQNALEKLISLGVVYPAFMTRGEVREKMETAKHNSIKWPIDPDGTPLYPTDERYLETTKTMEWISNGRPFTWRLNVDLALKRYGKNLHWEEFEDNAVKTVKANPKLWGDVIIARKDIPTSYHLSVVVDDALQKISHVVRGKDLFHSTSIHCLLQKILGFPTPFYHHHKLIYGENGLKLSKSNHDTSLRVLKSQGTTREDIIDYLQQQ